MKTWLLGCFMLLAVAVSSSAMAVERSVALPYQYGSNGSSGISSFLPKNCTSTQYVAVSGTFLVCRNLPAVAIPTCNAGQYVTVVNGSLACAAAPTANVPTCGANQYLTGNNGVFSCSAPVSSTTVWKTLNLSSHDDFNPDCTYRFQSDWSSTYMGPVFKIPGTPSKTWYYPTVVNDKSLIWEVLSGEAIYIQANSKTLYRYTNGESQAAPAWGLYVTAIQEKCSQ